MREHPFYSLCLLSGFFLVVACGRASSPPTPKPTLTAEISSPTPCQGSECPPQDILVDSCGANPFDDQTDSEAIQACIDQANSGDTVLFTSGISDPDYRGYLIDKTIFLVRSSVKSEVTFTSTDPNNHALLLATADLRGFVVRLFARSILAPEAGSIDDITFSHLDLDGNRAERVCFGPDGVDNGMGDNWGSWLLECDAPGDPWCSPGTLAMVGMFDDRDVQQDFRANPDSWSTGLVVQDVTIQNTECATALNLGAAASVIQDVTIDTAGEHVHVQGCEFTDPDEPLGAWADGITFYGPTNRIIDNLIVDASDVGIVFFGGIDTLITNNTVRARPDNNGMFAGIAVHPWMLSEISGLQVNGNRVTNEADPVCGGIHAGINIGAHMWGAGCVSDPWPIAMGNSRTCSSLSAPTGGKLCFPGLPCRIWSFVAEGETFTLTDNIVSGAQVNFLIEGLDVLGELLISGNSSEDPRLTDWQSDIDCTWDGITNSWGALDFVAHDPTVEGWLDRRIYCER
jgi:hypothetical protein